MPSAAAPYPSSPVMPMSYGLSYCMKSLPRSLWPIGAAISPASATTSSCAPSTPAPAKIATLPAALIASASARTLARVRHQRRRPEGRGGRGLGRRLEVGDVAGQGHHGDSRSPTACWMALCMTRGACSAVLIISE